MHGNLTKNDGYGYCDLWPVSDSVDFAACNECLRVQDMHYLANCESIYELLKACANTIGSLYYTAGGMRAEA